MSGTDEIEIEQNAESKSVLLTEGSFVADETTLAADEGEKPPVAVEIELTGLDKRTEDAIQETLSEKLDKISIHEEEEEVDYVTPVADPYARAIRYMEQHNVMQIFQKLTAEIIYHRPEDPLSHMLDELQKMKKERESNPPPVTPK